MFKFLKKEPRENIEVLVLDGETRAGLAVSRSLVRHGVSLIVLTETPQCFAYHSRLVRHLIHSPSSHNDPEAFIETVIEVTKKYQIQLVIPITDRTLYLLNTHRTSLSTHTQLAMPDSKSVQFVLNKRKNLELANKIGIPCPLQFELRDTSEIPQMIAELGFPIVMKNPGYTSNQDDRPFEFRYLIVHKEEQLRSYIQQHCKAGIYPLFQKCVSGKVYNLCCFVAKGDVIAMHCYLSIRRLRGQGVLRKILSLIPEIMEYSSRLLQATDWEGVAHLQFFIDEYRKEKWYIETNGRFWASTQGSIYAGWNFPVWVYDYYLHNKVPQLGDLKIGSQTCWHKGDLNALIDYWRKGISPMDEIHPGRIRATFQYLGDFSPRIHSDVFRWSDPKPALMEHWHYFKRIFR